MVSSVTALWLVAALVGGAFSLSCYHCNTAVCTENEKACSKMDDVCHTTITEIRTDKGQAKAAGRTVVKACGEKKLCNQTYSMSFNSTFLTAQIFCCSTDKCKTQETELPAKAAPKENQLKCTSCNEPTIKCSSPVTISCVGEETKCVSYTSKDAGPTATSQTWKGCVTDNVCTMKNMTTLPMNQILETKFDCNQASPLLSVLLLPITFGLAMLQFSL